MKNKATIIRQFTEDVLNNGNTEATGKYFHEDVVERGIVIGRFVDGKVKDTRIIMDALGLMAQLGAFPTH